MLSGLQNITLCVRSIKMTTNVWCMQNNTMIVMPKFGRNSINNLFIYFVCMCGRGWNLHDKPFSSFSFIWHHIAVACRWFPCCCCCQSIIVIAHDVELCWARQIELNNDWINNKVSVIKLCTHQTSVRPCDCVYVFAIGCFAGEPISFCWLLQRQKIGQVLRRVVRLDKRNWNFSNWRFLWRVRRGHQNAKCHHFEREECGCFDGFCRIW